LLTICFAAKTHVRVLPIFFPKIFSYQALIRQKSDLNFHISIWEAVYPPSAKCRFNGAARLLALPPATCARPGAL